MMRKNILLLMALIILTPLWAYANEAKRPVLKLENVDTLELVNPFESKFPLPEKEDPQIVDPNIRQPQRNDEDSSFRRTTTSPSPAVVTPEQAQQAIQQSLASSVVVTGVVWNSDRPQAIMNGQVLSQGDNFGEYTIANIQKEQIVLTANGQEFLIKP